MHVSNVEQVTILVLITIFRKMNIYPAKKNSKKKKQIET